MSKFYYFTLTTLLNMKRLILSIILISFLGVNVFSQNFDCPREWETVYIEQSILDCPDPSSYVYKINDDFDDNFFDLSVWRDQYPGVSSTSPFARLGHQCSETIYLLDNIVEEDNVLKIKQRYHENGISWTNDDGEQFNRDFSSGTFEGNSGINYGRIEGSFKLPAQGWMPAFWVWQHNEIDIFERFGWIDRFYYSSKSNDLDGITGADCDINVKVMDDMLADEFKYFAFEWTPFKLKFYYKDSDIPVGEVYRFYRNNGIPLDIECGENIPRGYYNLNPNYPEIINRFFTPGVNVPVAPRHAFQCCGNNEFCGDGDCTASEGCKPGWGNPLDNPDLSLNTETQIDFINAIDKNYNTCGSLAIRNINSSCFDSEGAILLEDWGGDESLHRVKNLSVTSSSNIVFDQDGMVINYIVNNDQDGYLDITYTDDCDNGKSIRYPIFIESSATANLNVNIFECDQFAEITFGRGSQCGISIFDIFSATVETLWNGTIELELKRDNGKLTLLFNGDYTVTNLTLFANVRQNSMPLSYSVDFCDDCCPENYYDDGANCHSGIYFNDVQLLIENNSFLTTKNCLVYADNNCCPSGTVEEGEFCLFSSIPSGYEGFIYENSFYLEKECDDCCPEGYTFDGGNCFSGKRFTEEYEAFVYRNKFYTKTKGDCEINSIDCCPFGTIYDNANCLWSEIPYGYEGFVYDNGFYVVPDCNTCCPPNTNYDGFNCLYEIDFSGVNKFVFDFGFYTTKNCEMYPNNDCCPPGTKSDGSNCLYKYIPSGFTGGVLNNQFYVNPLTEDCDFNLIYDESIEIRKEKQFTDIAIFPNPFINEFQISSKEILDEVTIEIYNLNGVMLDTRSINKLSIATIDIDIPQGIYFVKIYSIDKFEKTFKVLKM